MSGLPQVALEHRARVAEEGFPVGEVMSQNMRATCSSWRHGRIWKVAGIGDRQHVGLLQAGVPVDRRPVEGHALA
jgi:hypothetical protein